MIRKYKVNEKSFEEVSNEETAYWLGFLLADGGVVKNVLKLELSSKDVNHIYKFRYFLESTHPIKKRKDRYTHAVAISSSVLVSNLAKWGCVTRKTNTVVFPSDLPEQLIKHFIRGLFDGDGSIGIYKRTDKRCSNKVYHYTELKFRLCGTKEILETIQSILKVKSRIISMNGTFCLIIGRFKEVQKALDYLYKDAKIYLNRKQNQYLQVTNLSQPGSPHRETVTYASKKELLNNLELIKKLYEEKRSCRGVVRHLEKIGLSTSYHTITKLLRENKVTVKRHPTGWERKKSNSGP